MCESDLVKVKEVYETTHWKTVNEYLNVGWILLDKYKDTYDPEVFYDHQTFHYVLAWTKEGDPVKPKSPYSDLIIRADPVDET